MYEADFKLPFYKLIIEYLRNALCLLDEQGQQEVFQFLISQQNADGGFIDRGGRPDLYYSLFGMMLLKASPLNPPKGDLADGSGALYQLRQFLVRQSSSKIPGFIEKCCLALLQKELETGRSSRLRTLFSLGKSFWKERHSINLSYRSFVLFLTLDAVLPFRRIVKIGAKRMLARTTVDQHSPCSEVAAKVFLQKMMHRESSEDQELLMSFACDSGGFRAFQHSKQPDMLSTAVALFALGFAGSDLRLLKPDCLHFIQQNFVDGAFLSGDGDPTTDLEYTFYGLLALGVLAN